MYSYLGAGAAGDLVKGFPSDLVHNEPEGRNQHIRTNIFNRFFRVRISNNIIYIFNAAYCLS